MIDNIIKGVKWYCQNIWWIHKRLLYVSIKRVSERANPHFACKLMNLNQMMTGRQVRFGFDGDLNLYIAKDADAQHFFAEKMRGFWLYSQGVELRGKAIHESYFLELVKFESDDVVIDCGANYADLYLKLAKLADDIRYISFEPSPKEYQCILLNAPGQEHHQKALNNRSGTIDLFISSKGADSSVLEPSEGYTQKLSIEAITLNEFAQNIEKIKLLKLEAEGAEPEILDGALEVLHRIAFIAADGGAERGLAEESTIESITNTLLAHNFELVKLDISSGKGRALYRNTALS